MNIDLSDKIVLITGGSRGIGAACVRLFAEAGASAAFTFFNSKKSADILVNELDSQSVKAYKTDISSEIEIRNCAAKVVKDFGSIHILVNNAGIWKPGTVDEMKLADWDETIKINLNSTFLFTKYVVPEMKKNNYGKVVNVSSTAGQRGEAGYSHYASSKGAIISFTKSLAAELGNHNINVNCVAPGWVLTDMTNDVLSEPAFLEDVRKSIPLHRIAEPQDIAAPILFLAADLARHITGEVLNVNGGSVLCG